MKFFFILALQIQGWYLVLMVSCSRNSRCQMRTLIIVNSHFNDLKNSLLSLG